MAEFLLGTKNYDTDWFLKYGLSYNEAAKLLADSGFSFLMTQNRFLPMADSAVASEVTPEMAARYAAYDDLKFREALGNAGVGYWPTLNIFFNPAAIEADSSLRPIGWDGKLMPTLDWYVGISPAREDYVAQQIEKLITVTEKLEPEGIFLAFTRWPGFWELWLPHHFREDFTEYDYDEHTLQRFARETRIELPSYIPVKASTWIDSHVREAWTAWKCQVVTDVVRQVRTAVRQIKPDVQIMINTLPFGYNDYDNARDKTFGQHLETLSEVVDIFEVMTYHQILKRPVEWIPQIGQEVKRRTGKTTVCTIQSEPLYLEGMHAPEKRSPSLDDAEFAAAVNAVETGNLDGVVIFVWSDLLKRAFADRDHRRIEILQTAIHNRKSQLEGK